MSQKRQSRAKSQASRTIPERQIPGWLWLLTGIVVGAFVMFLIHLSELKRANIAPQESTTKPAKQTEPKKEQEKDSDVVFEFYDRLKEEQVSIPKYKTPTEATRTLTHHYFLQVASFRNHDDADKARASLILLNMTPNIEESTLQSGATAYRVIVGPYTSKSKLAKARDTLVSNGFEFLTLKRKI